MDLSIRRADKSDIDALALLYVEFHNFHAVGVPTRLRIVELDEALPKAIGVILDNPEAAVFVACDGFDVLGFVEIYRRESEANPAVVPRCYAHLQSLMVTAKARKLGIGRRLVTAAHEWARSRGATEVELDTWEFAAGPLRFYESLGYGTMRRQLVVPLKEEQP